MYVETRLTSWLLCIVGGSAKALRPRQTRSAPIVVIIRSAREQALGDVDDSKHRQFPRAKGNPTAGTLAAGRAGLGWAGRPREAF